MARILVIDDAKWSRDYIKDILIKQGHDVITEGDSKRAVEMYADGDFDAIITDIFMPEMDGIEVMTFLRKRQVKSKILAMSGGSERMSPDDALMIARHMADGVLKKPFKSDELLGELSKVTAIGSA